MHIFLNVLPGNPLGPGVPGAPGGPIGPGGPGVNVDSLTAVVNARTYIYIKEKITRIIFLFSIK